MIHDKDATVKHLIDLDADAFDFATATDGNTQRIVTPREMLMPYDDNGTVKAKRVQALCSDFYGDPVTIGGSVDVQNSIEKAAANGKLQLVGDAATPGNYYAYCTNGSGAKGWLQGVTIAF